MSQKPWNKYKCCLVFSMNLQIQVFSKIIVQDFIGEKRPSRSDSLPEETKKLRGFPKEANEDEPALLEMQHMCFTTLLSIFLKVAQNLFTYE